MNIFKSPKFVVFGTNLTHLWPKSDMVASVDYFVITTKIQDGWRWPGNWACLITANHSDGK